MISTANITMQFGAKPLFEDISVKFGDGNRYGLDRCQRLRKNDLYAHPRAAASRPPRVMSRSTPGNERIGKLSQDQFAFEEYTVLDTVIMGHTCPLGIESRSATVFMPCRKCRKKKACKVAELESRVRRNGRLQRREPRR